MGFTSVEFYLFLAVVVIAYYVFPLKYRWTVLLGASLFYFAAAAGSIRAVVVFAGIIVGSWMMGLLLEHLRQIPVSAEDSNTADTNAAAGKSGDRSRKLILLCCVILILLPLLVSRSSSLLYELENLLHSSHTGILIPLGLSFFTMQIIAYLVDVDRGDTHAQKNLFKYALFVSFFPQILQGPIPRYDQLEPQLIRGHRFDDDGFVRGFMLIIWGFFLKFMIADRAGIVVDTIYADSDIYPGVYVLVAGILYSIQLYTDFLACVTLAQGTSELFGIHLTDNFHRPYLAVSVKDFWGRWHISLSRWLRDYVYIPLGGNRRGRLRRYVNLVITFAVSGIWHGAGLKYLFWGLMHAGYQIAGDLSRGIRNRICGWMGMPEGRRCRTYVQRFCTFGFVMLAWIVFRADSFQQGLSMLKSLFTTYNLWMLSNGHMLELGLDTSEWMLLIFSVLILIFVSSLQEKGVILRDVILRQPLLFRWGLYLTATAVIMVFGVYGYGFNASDFIYGNF